MAAIANVAVYDGADTPVLHTFLPKGIKVQGDLIKADWYEYLAGVPVYACPRLSIIAQKVKNGMTRTGGRFEIPVMEAVAGANASGYTAAPKVAYVTVSEIVLWSHDRSTAADRKIARMLPINLGNNVSTSVAAAAAGPLRDAFDLMVMPT